jgi:Tfp pilus assembly protein PilO
VRGLLLFVFGAAFPLAAYLGFFYPDRSQALKAAETRLAAREKELQALSGVADRLPAFQREQEQQKQRLTELDRIRPQSSDTASLLDDLRQLAADEGVTRVVVEESAASASAETLPIQLKAEGGQRQLAGLLGRLGRTTRLLRLERVELERLEGGRYALALRLCAFREKPAL